MILALISLSLAPIKVAVIDTGYKEDVAPYLCKDVKSKDFTGEGIYDTVNHGNIVSKIILANSKGKACIVMLKVFNSNQKLDYNKYNQALQYLANHRVDIINISMDGIEPLDFEKKQLDFQVNRGVKVIASAGNSGMNLDNECLSFPACNGNAIVVGTKVGKNLASYTNYGKIVNEYEQEEYYENKRGTSFSAATFSGRLAYHLYRLHHGKYNR